MQTCDRGPKGKNPLVTTKVHKATRGDVHQAPPGGEMQGRQLTPLPFAVSYSFVNKSDQLIMDVHCRKWQLFLS